MLVLVIETAEHRAPNEGMLGRGDFVRGGQVCWDYDYEHEHDYEQEAAIRIRSRRVKPGLKKSGIKY
jgi:hypothetical protein